MEEIERYEEHSELEDSHNNSSLETPLSRTTVFNLDDIYDYSLAKELEVENKRKYTDIGILRYHNRTAIVNIKNSLNEVLRNHSKICNVEHMKACPNDIGYALPIILGVLEYKVGVDISFDELKEITTNALDQDLIRKEYLNNFYNGLSIKREDRNKTPESQARVFASRSAGMSLAERCELRISLARELGPFTRENHQYINESLACYAQLKKLHSGFFRFFKHPICFFRERSAISEMESVLQNKLGLEREFLDTVTVENHQYVVNKLEETLHRYKPVDPNPARRPTIYQSGEDHLRNDAMNEIEAGIRRDYELERIQEQLEQERIQEQQELEKEGKKTVLAHEIDISDEVYKDAEAELREYQARQAKKAEDDEIVITVNNTIVDYTGKDDINTVIKDNKNVLEDESIDEMSHDNNLDYSNPSIGNVDDYMKYNRTDLEDGEEIESFELGLKAEEHMDSIDAIMEYNDLNHK